MMPGTGDEDPGRPGRPGLLPRRRNDDTAIYRAFTAGFDEVVEADALCDADELTRLRICSISSSRICKASLGASPTGCSAA